MQWIETASELPQDRTAVLGFWRDARPYRSFEVVMWGDGRWWSEAGQGLPAKAPDFWAALEEPRLDAAQDEAAATMADVGAIDITFGVGD